MIKLISSQRYIDEATVAQKIEKKDFTVLLSPVFVIDGQEYQAVMDGHHSYHAALEAGVEPNYIIQTAQENDKIALIKGNIDEFLEAAWVDSNWYEIETGINIF